jgi:hypothetical protein
MDGPILKKRKIVVAGAAGQGRADTLKELRKKDGVISAAIDEKKNVIKVEYDLRRIGFEAIEKTISGLGFCLSRKWPERFRRGLVKFTEQNEFDNLSAPASSCCHDPRDNASGCGRCAR